MVRRADYGKFKRAEKVRTHTFRVPLFVASLVLAAAFLTYSTSRAAFKTGGTSSSKPASVQGTDVSPTSSSEKKFAMRHALGRMPLYFIENRGQLDRSVAY